MGRRLCSHSLWEQAGDTGCAILACPLQVAGVAGPGIEVGARFSMWAFSNTHTTCHFLEEDSVLSQWRSRQASTSSTSFESDIGKAVRRWDITLVRQDFTLVGCFYMAQPA